jgi:hypothetical protein
MLALLTASGVNRMGFWSVRLFRWHSRVSMRGSGSVNFQTMSLSSGGSFGKRVNSRDVSDAVFLTATEATGVRDSMLANVWDSLVVASIYE